MTTQFQFTFDESWIKRDDFDELGKFADEIGAMLWGALRSDFMILDF